MASLPFTITCEQTRAMLESATPPVLLDVRNQDEFDFARIAGSVLIPLHELEERRVELSAFDGRQVVVLCHLGVRSMNGAGYLRSLGYDAASLIGGIEAWSTDIDPEVPRY